MKTSFKVVLLLALPAVVQAQFTYTTNNGAIKITGYTGSNGVVTIPDRIPDTTNGLPVTSIGDSAFFDCWTLTSVTIGTNVTSIEYEAFDSCVNLTNITISYSVTSIGYAAFCYCESLTSIMIGTNVTSIGDWAFDTCWDLTSVTIANSLTSIGDGAFYGCVRLASVYFQGNAPSLGGTNVFFNADNATVYYLPGTTGWSTNFAGCPTALWLPEMQTTDPSFGVRTNPFGFNINWASGMTVVVEACTSLANPVWYPLATNTLTSGSSYFSDPQWANYPNRFYRLRSP